METKKIESLEQKEKKEAELLDRIRRSAQGAVPPESLQPEKIEGLLSDAAIESRKRQKKKGISSLSRWVGAAAVLAFAVTALWQTGRLSKETESPDRVMQADRRESSALAFASDYQEVYAALYETFYQEPAAGSGAGYVTLEMAAKDTAASLGNYSSTNIQEPGVEEADLVKTDGTWIYLLGEDGTLTIVKADPKEPVLESVLTLEGGPELQVHECYLDGDRLSVITSTQSASLSEEEGVYQMESGTQTTLSTYDLSDRSQPVLMGSVTQDGSYETSRKTGDYLYLFTSYAPRIADTWEASDLSPRVNGAALDAGSVYLPEHLNTDSYLVLSSVSLEDPDTVLDTKALVSGTTNFYVSAENIYIANEVQGDAGVSTELVKFRYEDGAITGTAAGLVKGSLNNSFSMSEYEGFLRLVSTYYDEDWNEYNALFILDETLSPAGSIQDLAKGETIRSARFLGDTGYFVTFRQTDPLFSVDLSDPENPRILGELKVTGFSSYLHFYGEDALLGLGYEADEETGAVTGLKLSMFDVSDPENVTEKDRLILSGVTWCASLDDYKSILIDPEKNVFGFFCDSRYLVFSYQEDQGFQTELIYDFYPDQMGSQGGNVLMDESNSRGLYIGDTLYLAGPSCVIAFDMEQDFQETGRLWLKEN